MRNDNIAELLIDFNNLEFHCLAYELVVVAYRMDVNLAAGQECLDAEYVYNHATFGTALDVTLDNILIVKRGVDALPALAEAGFLCEKGSADLSCLPGSQRKLLLCRRFSNRDCSGTRLPE